MRGPLESYDDNAYDRPSTPWRCGHAEGAECMLGPTHLGVCQASAECVPRKMGDRWECNRPAMRGGACHGGPLVDGTCRCRVENCSPVRSLRNKRGLFALCCFALTLGALMIVMNSESRREFLAPGPLTTQHAQILAGPNVENRCASCHPAGNLSTPEWFLHTVGLPVSTTQSLVEAHASTQTELCLNCHDKSFDRQHAKFAHNLDPQVLYELTRAATPNASRIQFVRFEAPKNAQGELACSACHREHHGSQHNLSELSNSQCQSCHQQQFASFEADHPEISNWAYQRRPRIAFDHVSHGQKHFREASRQFQCDACHQSQNDHSNEIVSVTTYASCYECHEKKIVASLVDGVPLLRLPTIDTDVLLDAGFDVGQWPVRASGEFDGSLPPLMQLLLLADDKAKHAIEGLGADFDLADVDSNDSDQLQLVFDLIWSIKRLMHELAVDAGQTLRMRFRATLGCDVDGTALDHLHASFATSSFALCADRWFLDLPQDVRLEFGQSEHIGADSQAKWSFSPRYQAGTQSLARDSHDALKKAWNLNAESFLVSYFPTGHDDTFLALMIDLLSTTQGSSTGVPHDVIRASWKSLTSSTSIGQCTSCHSVDQVAGRTRVNWRAGQELESERVHGFNGFTRFSHAPHLIQPELSDCQHCHQVDSSANFMASYKGDQAEFTPNFHPITKASCVGCHNTTAKKDACVTCHPYHIHGDNAGHSQEALIAEGLGHATDSRK